MTVPDNPDLLAGMSLLDTAKQRGFSFCRVAPGPDGPVEGTRETETWRDVIHLGGFSRDCFAWRERISSLILPGGGLVQIRAQGGAVDVLTEVLTWPDPPP